VVTPHPSSIAVPPSRLADPLQFHTLPSGHRRLHDDRGIGVIFVHIAVKANEFKNQAGKLGSQLSPGLDLLSEVDRPRYVVELGIPVRRDVLVYQFSGFGAHKLEVSLVDDLDDDLAQAFDF